MRGSRLFVDDLNQYRRWSTHKTAVATRYLRLTFESPSAQIAEIVLYGTARGARATLPQPARRPPALMDSFIGDQRVRRRSHRADRRLRAPAGIPSVAMGRGKPGLLLPGLSRPSVGLEPQLGQRSGLGLGFRRVLSAVEGRRRGGGPLLPGLRPVSRRLRQGPHRREARPRRHRSDAAAIVRRTRLLPVPVRRPLRQHALRRGPPEAQGRPAGAQRPGARAVHGELERAGQVVEGTRRRISRRSSWPRCAAPTTTATSGPWAARSASGTPIRT